MSSLHFFLGGHDLEMLTIRELLERHAPERFCDRGLSWGAKASAYSPDVAQALARGETPVLVELENDLPWPARTYSEALSAVSAQRQPPEPPPVILATKVSPSTNTKGHASFTPFPDLPEDQSLVTSAATLLIVDHHGLSAKADHKTSLEQVFELLALPSNAWTRWHALVAANDRGHVRELQALGATREEIIRVRASDRAAQGVTDADEQAAIVAIAQREELAGGQLTILRLANNRTSPAADRMEPLLGGPGYQNLLIVSPDEYNFFGLGAWVLGLDQAFPGGWRGGALPERGFWGAPRSLVSFNVLQTKLLKLAQFPDF